MTKYDLDFKFQIVADYEAGVGGYSYLATKYHLERSVVKRWVHNYRDFGLDGLKPKQTKQHYTTEFKLNAIQLYQESELSYRQVGVQLGINNPSLIANWRRAYKEKGIDGLSRSLGGSSKMPKNTSNQLDTQPEDVQELKDRIEELELQNKNLDIQNKFLKELRRLREADERQRKNN